MTSHEAFIGARGNGRLARGRLLDSDRGVRSKLLKMDIMYGAELCSEKPMRLVECCDETGKSEDGDVKKVEVASEWLPVSAEGPPAMFSHATLPNRVRAWSISPFEAHASRELHAN